MEEDLGNAQAIQFHPFYQSTCEQKLNLIDLERYVTSEVVSHLAETRCFEKVGHFPPMQELSGCLKFLNIFHHLEFHL